jgi:hypothetical protein
MAGLSIDYVTVETGPMFDGEGPIVMARYCDELRQTMADEIEALVKFHLATVLRHSRGVYIGATHQVAEGDTITVTDRWIVYGPWLEGVGTRVGPPGSGKWPLTRFEGYHTYRIVADEYNLIAHERADEMLQPYIAILNA